jgi:hypothetical protein
MTKSKNQTVPTLVSVAAYIASLPIERQVDVKTLTKMMEKASGKKAVMWGPRIIGCDQYHYVYESGREGDSPRLAFSPRVGNLTLYIMTKTSAFQALMKKFGKYRMSGSCIQVKKLSDVDLGVLEKMMTESLKDSRKKHP